MDTVLSPSAQLNLLILGSMPSFLGGPSTSSPHRREHRVSDGMHELANRFRLDVRIGFQFREDPRCISPTAYADRRMVENNSKRVTKTNHVILHLINDSTDFFLNRSANRNASI